MTKTRPIHFGEFRDFLLGLGYVEKSPESAHVFHRQNKDRLFFRRYREDEEVEVRDLVSTRKFLDAWGLVDASQFDAFVSRSTTSA
jgi:hypothetical protein